MSKVIHRPRPGSVTRPAIALGIAAALFTLGACSSEVPADNGSSAGSLSGDLVGSGATSQEAAQSAWRSSFSSQESGVRVSYNGGGSGKGVSDFTSGAVSFAGSDEALPLDEMQAGAFAACSDNSNALNLPVYISPIAMVFHIDGVDTLNLDAATTAGIFSGQITTWNDAAITALNPGTELPDEDITVVHRSDKSGTTENFTETLAATAPQVWTNEASQTWPESYGGESAEGTSGVVAAVKNGSGAIGYADMSQASGLSVASFGTEGNFVQPTADATAQLVAASPKRDGGPDGDQALELDRTGAGYPFALVSYAIACQEYEDASQGALVKAYLSHLVSTEGQQAAQNASGSAPLPSELASSVADSIGTIK